MLIKSLFYKHKDIERKENILKKLKEETPNLPSNSSSEKVQTNSFTSMVEDRALQIVFLENELKVMKKEFEETKEKVIENINSIDNPRYKDLLFLRYICFKKWEEIADIFGYSVTHIFRLHNDALIILEEIKK